MSALIWSVNADDLKHLLETEADEELDLLMDHLSTEWWVRVLLDSTKQIDGITLMKLITKLLKRGVIHEQTFKTLLVKMQPVADSGGKSSLSHQGSVSGHYCRFQCQRLTFFQRY